MRLRTVKICGFKSFADPVTLKMDVPMMCIVGPNGCGKSNIVEAITWAMGESRASAMRSESMQNVIFNGTAARKPVDWCSVELRLDNTDDAGFDLKAWSGYPEIVVKRELERDGNSTYRINNQIVRRRDVNDLFSGTGLGAHGYSVIFQGTVARVVEENPAHIKAYLEEAAGVTHYKDRRRETEAHLRRAEENQEALENTRSELAAHVAKLRRQASVALRYRELSEQISQLNLLLLEWRGKEIAGEVAALAAERTAKSAAEKILGEKKDALISETAALRAQHKEKMDAHQKIQMRAYTLQGTVSRIGQQLESLRQNRKDCEEAISGSEKNLQELGDQRKALLAEQEGHVADEKAAGKASAKLSAEAAQAAVRAAELAGAGEKMRKAREKAAEEANQMWHLLQTRQMQLTVQGKQDQNLADLLAAAEAKLAELDESLAKGKEATDQVVAAKKRTSALLRDKASKERGLQKLQARLANLEAARGEMQAEELKMAAELSLLMSVGEALGQDARTWAESRKLKQQELLAQVKIDAKGWEAAVDAALGGRVAAYLVDDLWAHAGTAGPLPAGIELVARGARLRGDSSPGRLEALASKVECPREWEGLVAWLLSGHYAVADAAAARASLPHLGPGEWAVTPSGEMYSKDCVRAQPELRRGHDWSRRIRGLRRDAEQLREKIAAKDRETEEARGACAGKKREIEALASEADAAAQQQREAEHTAAALGARSKMAAEQRQEIAAQAKSIRADQAKSSRVRADLEAGIAAAEKQIGKLEAETERLSRLLKEEDDKIARHEQNAAQHGRDAADREDARREAATNARVAAAKIEGLGARMAATQAEIARRKADLEKMDEKELGESKAKEEKLLEEANAAAAAALEEANAVAARIEALEDSRQKLDGDLTAVHDRVQRIGFEESSRNEEAKRIAAEIAAIDCRASEELRAAIADGAAARSRMEALVAKRDRLGDINFAAESELNEAAAREGEIERQREDVRDAIANLTGAISRIDEEMLARLRDVFAKVSRKFDELFRTVFGGGSASLELDGNSLLEAGVRIKASPPGKTIDRMHLLSGGEKSLVALSFILAIFSLNPAPFCIMDEVDAALDDRNTLMLNNLLQSFSSQVQFMLVTHNKITADMAARLVGVTQLEKGVSSVVTVKVSDIDSFVEAGRAA